MIPRSRRNLFSFGNNNNAITKVDKSHAGGGAACKGRVGVGRRSAPGMVQCRGTRRLGTVVGVCLVPDMTPVIMMGLLARKIVWVIYIDPCSH